MAAVLMVSSLLSIAYLMPVVGRGFFCAPQADAEGAPHGNPGSGIHEAPLLCVLPPLLTGIGCIVLFLFVDGVYDLLKGIGAP